MLRHAEHGAAAIKALGSKLPAVAVKPQKPTAPSLPLTLYLEKLKRERGADWVGIPFKGGGETTNAILSGSTPIGLIGLGNVTSQIAAGKMTALALTNNIRTPLLPNVPTVEEAGVPRFESATKFAVFAPAGSPGNLGIGLVGVSLAFGLTVVTGAYALGHVSGGHFNPAVTLADAWRGGVAWPLAAAYVVVQIAGALGGRHLDPPYTADRVWRALRAGRTGAGGSS